MDERIKPLFVGAPIAGDEERAGDILDEILQVLKKHGCVLSHSPEAMVLAKITTSIGHEARAIALVRQITPDFIEWKKIRWAPREAN